ncbi:MAG: hypothetical protein K6E92_08875 [Lachnospiraceae bacterium]|nr:hypothetical protein [Lachnospiraceae bacterium]
MKNMTPKRIAALLIVILLVFLYLITLIAAIFDPSKSGQLFGLCLFATVAIPLMAYIYIYLYGKVTGKHTIASTPDLPEESPLSEETSASESPADETSGAAKETENETHEEP